MSDYTPSTQQVRDCYKLGAYQVPDADIEAAMACFDRWLAENNRQVAEKAWNEGGLAELNEWAPAHDGPPFRMRMRNPYRAPNVVSKADD